MKVLSAVLFLAVLITPSLVGQIQWEPTSGPWAGQITAILAASDGRLYCYSNSTPSVTPAIGGVMMSGDSGKTWTFSGMQGYDLTAIAEGPTGSLFAGGTSIGVYRSTNDGTSWSSASTGLTNQDVYSFAVGDSGHLFAGTGGGGVFRSTNNGDTWTPTNTGLTGLYIYVMTVDGNGDLFASSDGGIVRSTDNGHNWTATTGNGLATGATTIIATGTGTLVAGSIDGAVYRTTNAGEDWTPATTNLDGLDVFSLAINSFGVIAGTDNGGVYFSTDNGDTWEVRNNGVARDIVRALSVNPSSNHIYLASDAAGVYLSTDNGTTWLHRSDSLGYASTENLAATGSGTLFAATKVGMYLSTNNGYNWHQVNQGLSHTWMLSVAVGSTGNIFAGTYAGGAYRSTDGGISWTPMPSLSAGTINCLTVDPVGAVYAGTMGAGVFISTNQGGTWNQMSSGVSDPDVRAIAVSPANKSYAATFSGIYVSTNSGVSWSGPTDPTYFVSLTIGTNESVFGCNPIGIYVSTDFGDTWDTTGQHHGAVEMAFTGSGDMISAGYGMYRSTNGGVTWDDISGDPPITGGPMAIINGDQIFVSAYPGAIYRSTSVPTGIENTKANIPGNIALHQNYPNPFNPETAISYQLSVVSDVRVSVFDILGREVAILVDEAKPAGVHRLTWNASGLPSGVYFYRLDAGHFVETRRLLLLR